MKLSIQKLVLTTALMGSFSSGAYATPQQIADLLAREKGLSAKQANHVTSIMLKTSANSTVANASMNYIDAKKAAGKNDAEIDTKLDKKSQINNWALLEQRYNGSVAKASKNAQAGGQNNGGQQNQGNPNVFDVVRDTPIVQGYFANSPEHAGLFEFVSKNVGQNIFGMLIDQSNFDGLIRWCWSEVIQHGNREADVLNAWKNNTLTFFLQESGFGVNGNLGATQQVQDAVWAAMSKLNGTMDTSSQEYKDVTTVVEDSISLLFSPALRAFAADAFKNPQDSKYAAKTFRKNGFVQSLEKMKKTLGKEQMFSVFPARADDFDGLKLSLPLFESMKDEADPVKRKELVWQFVLDQNLLGSVDKAAANVAELADGTKTNDEFATAFKAAHPNFVEMTFQQVVGTGVKVQFNDGVVDQIQPVNSIALGNARRVHNFTGPEIALLKPNDVILADLADFDFTDNSNRTINNAVVIWK